jgi:hypothetical protein
LSASGRLIYNPAHPPRTSPKIRTNTIETRNDITDFNRWTDASTTWGKKYPARAEVAGEEIPDGASVLDIGAGSMVLSEYLKPGCTYQPCDLLKRTPDCLVANLNRGEFPRERHYDFTVMLGVLMYLSDPEWAIHQCASVSNSAVFAYTPALDEPSAAETSNRGAAGWVNHFTQSEYISLVEDNGFKVVKMRAVPYNLILVCQQARQHESATTS